MKPVYCLVGLLGLCFATAEAHAGGPPPVCMAVDKLVFEPNEEAPTRVQIWGTFALLNGSKAGYGEPMRRYLYYTAAPGKEAECRKEWAKLKKLLAERHLISYGMCGQPEVADQLRKPSEKPEAPTPFPLVEAGFANADNMSTQYPSLQPLLKLSKQGPRKEGTPAVRKAAPEGK